MKPEFFCCIGGELKDTIQGIFKCSRIFLYRAAQSQTIDDMLVDGFFNNADDIRVNDLIILYCPEESRAYTFAKVSSIIGGVVKTKELDTPNLPANVSAFFNDAGYLTASELATVAFTGNLSDLNDITITNPATGEYLRWNGDKWINMAGGGGGSAVWGSIGGDIEDQADLQLALAGKADVTDLANKANTDMDNLTDTGANIANWSHNVTNCITEISQDIKLELNSGTLTLKAGSKVYVPNGVGVFDEVTVASDLTLGPVGSYTGTDFIYLRNDGSTLDHGITPEATSGTTAPTGTGFWFDTTNNLVKFYSSGADTGVRTSLPIAIIHRTSGSWDSIDKVFNGFGYIGSTVFALPGVKGLIPNGRNADGTLKSTSFTLSSVQTLTETGTNNYTFITNGTNIGNSTIRRYDEALNRIVNTTNNTFTNECIIGTYTRTSGVISNFNTKQSFHAFDYNDLMIMTFDALYPVGAIYIGTQNTCPLATLIPGSTWQLVATDRALWGGNGSNANTTIAAGLPDGRGAFTESGANVTSVAGGMHKASSYSAGWGSTGGDNTATVEYRNSWWNSIFGQSNTVQPPAYRVNVWRRTA